MSSYFHGGTPDLRVGDYVLPPTETGAPSLASYGAAGICRRDQVYVATDVTAAVMYAATHPSGRGKVYQVEPIGEVTADPDCQITGLSYSCAKARIVAVMSVRGKLLKRVRAVLVGGAS